MCAETIEKLNWLNWDQNIDVEQRRNGPEWAKHNSEVMFCLARPFEDTELPNSDFDGLGRP